MSVHPKSFMKDDVLSNVGLSGDTAQEVHRVSGDEGETGQGLLRRRANSVRVAPDTKRRKNGDVPYSGSLIGCRGRRYSTSVSLGQKVSWGPC